MRVSSSIHVAANGIILFLLWLSSIPLCVCVCLCVYTHTHHIFLIQSSVHGHLGCFHVFANVNSAAMNMWVHVSFLSRVLSGYMPKSGIAGSYGEWYGDNLENYT